MTTMYAQPKSATREAKIERLKACLAEGYTVTSATDGAWVLHLRTKNMVACTRISNGGPFPAELFG